MNFNLPFIPERPDKPRHSGLTMVMDKGLSLREAEDFCDVSSEYVDLVKLGFGTGLLTPKLKEKIKLYQQAGLKPYFGGTLFEAFIARDMFDDFRRFISESGVDTAEVSDGVLPIEHGKKCQYIETLSKDLVVLSEVGTKLKGKEISNEEWVSWMQTELQAGAWKVIAEARESGNIGIYNEDGSANSKLILDIRKQLNADQILWEAPLKSQQVWFIKLLGANVNLGNIAENEVIPLETLRRGLRGDTLLSFLPCR
ncbi:phosphosulfolactate synthase [Gaoshiqia sp. Z1-71]|uniref:phosphosulfolactate synthase n=1 Tax=Gaoshiqia hydrogeniformans TaxID=3290090 RepID=UPI003BF7D6AA